MGRLAVGSIITLFLLGTLGCGNVTQNVSTGLVDHTVQHETVTKPDAPLVAVLPHHDLVQTQRQNLLATLAKRSQPDTIILISPNHFAAGNAGIQTTDRTWNLAGGTEQIVPDQTVIQGLADQGVVSIEDGSFNNEHGIKNILSDLHDAFPNAKLVPLILKDAVTPEQVSQLSQLLTTNCQLLSCGLIASVDMSHYNPAALADLHDIKTLRDLNTLDETDVWNTEVDSPPSLALLLAWAKQQQVEQFVLTDHTNSGTILGDADGETTTHIMGYYTAGESVAAASPLTFMLAGDMMYGREIGYQFQNNNYQDLFANFGNRVFWGSDVSWANLEGPMSDQIVTQERQPDNLIFLFSKQGLSALTYLKLTTIGLANNHTANHGRAGLETTRQMVESADLDWVGDPYGINDTSVKRYSYADIDLSMIAVNQFDGDLTGLTDLIQQEHNAGQFVLVIPHWGTEYATQHTTTQERLATEWIAAGADLIIGMHPHVIEDAQVIDGKLVLYSLGNFIFDQTFSAETQQGLIVGGELTADQFKLILVPVFSKQLKPELAKGEQKQMIIDRICGNIQEYCADGTITVPR